MINKTQKKQSQYKRVAHSGGVDEACKVPGPLKNNAEI